MLSAKAYAASVAAAPLSPFQIERRRPGAHDVLIDILYCGICHTDIHFTRGHFSGVTFPAVPGHEIVGRVAAVGHAVQRHRENDTVGVGCIIGSCGTCTECLAGAEQYCNKMVGTFGGVESDGKTPTYGGYSTCITVDEHFVLKIPSVLTPPEAAPLLCAGITAYSPLRYWKVGRASQVAVAGLGGLGHVAVKIAAAMGADVTVLSTSASKAADATRLGAKDFVMMHDALSLARCAARFDLILNTVSAGDNYEGLIKLLRWDGTLVLLGIPDGPVCFNAAGLIGKRKRIAGSLVGSIRETQEMLDFCADQGIVADIELIPMERVNEAYERVLRSDVRYRFVIDMASLR